MKRYEPKQIEQKWQEYWQEKRVNELDMDKARKPFLNLMMFPYPSAEGLHIGGMYTFTGVDTFGRYMKMRGYDVFEPIGLDAFGIHSENYALKIGEHIREVSKRTEKHFYEQLHSMGNMYDWSRTVETHKPEYYKWTQWLFLQLFKSGLAYRDSSLLNYCPKDKTVLADEQVIDGKCERCGTEVIKKEMVQWFFKITKYADRLNENLTKINWDNDVKLGQHNWIGKSTGAHLDFVVNSGSKTAKLRVFTTRPDTIFGATFLVLAPEHPLLKELAPAIKNYNQVEKYLATTLKKDDLQRTDLNKDKTGVRLEGVTAINPATNQEIPVFIADYVLVHYGTGAIMAVPGHDQRDFDFARKHHLPVIRVIKPINKSKSLILHQSVDENFANLLKQQGYTVTTSAQGHLQVELNDSQVEAFIELMRKNISQNFFVDIIGSHNRVIFNDQVISTDTIEGELKAVREITERFPRLAKTHDLSSLMLFQAGDELEEGSFYADLLAYDGPGEMVNSGQFNKTPTAEAFDLIMEWLEAINVCEKAVTYKLRDWVVSRQRYWGPPIPMIYCEQEAKESKSWFNTSPEAKKMLTEAEIEFLSNEMKGWFPDEQLPILLPEIADFEAIKPDGSGKGPLAAQAEFVKTKCPHCGADAVRETDVSDPFVDSSWYFLRYPFTEFDFIPFGGNFNNPKSLFHPHVPETELERTNNRMKKWEPVASYIGGKEHTVLHLLYARFITMVFHDLGYLEFEEPFAKFIGHGLITKDGAKMSKSKGNVINPDEYIEKYGADAVRMYLRFMGPFDQGGDWRDTSMDGMNRFILRLWRLYQEFVSEKEVEKPEQEEAVLHKTIKGVGEDLAALKFNTSVAKIMQLVNWYQDSTEQMGTKQKRKVLSTLCLILAPLAPHLAEEFWEIMGNKPSVHVQAWPEYEPNKIMAAEITMAIQINGKVRDTVSVEVGAPLELIEEAVAKSVKLHKYLDGKQIKKTIYVKDKVVNYIV